MPWDSESGARETRRVSRSNGLIKRHIWEYSWEKDMQQAMKDTWQKVTRKLKTAVNLWKARTLSLRGKALVINTCMVSRTVYTASVFPMPTETLTELTRSSGRSCGTIHQTLYHENKPLDPCQKADWV